MALLEKQKYPGAQLSVSVSNSRIDFVYLQREKWEFPADLTTVRTYFTRWLIRMNLYEWPTTNPASKPTRHWGFRQILQNPPRKICTNWSWDSVCSFFLCYSLSLSKTVCFCANLIGCLVFFTTDVCFGEQAFNLKSDTDLFFFVTLRFVFIVFINVFIFCNFFSTFLFQF